MRAPLLLFLAFAAAGSLQGNDLIPAVYLAPQYVASLGAPSTVVVAGIGEPGERLVVTGRVLEGTKPVAGVSVYVFHTDAEGRYAKGISGNEAELNPRLHGALRTDARGRYRYETIRPGSYDNNPAHVHYVVVAPGYKPRLLDLWFEDDPILVARRKAGEPEIPPGIRNSPIYKAAPDAVVIRTVMRDASGIWRTTRDIQMVRQ